MNDIDRACAAFRTLLEEQQARVAGMTAEQVDYTNKATVTIGLVDGDGIGPIIMEQAVRALEALLADGYSIVPVSQILLSGDYMIDNTGMQCRANNDRTT